MTTATRIVGSIAEHHFGTAEVPFGELITLDVGVPVIVLGSQEEADGSHELALCQVPYKQSRAAVYVPWAKITVAGRRTFELDDGEASNGLPFPIVR